MKRLALGAVATLALLLLAALVLVKLLYGGGKAYPDVSTEPLIPQARVETLASLEFPPGNVSVANDGRIFFAYHPFAQAHRFDVPTMFELVGGVPKPYPRQKPIRG